MRTKQHIKRCPFCGGKAGLYEDYTTHWVIQCNTCGATTLKRGDYKEALLNWNRRVYDNHT